MELFELFQLIWADRNSGGLGTLLVYLIPTAMIFTIAVGIITKCSNSSIHNEGE